MPKQPTQKPKHKYAHLAGTYRASCGTLYRVACESGDALTQQRQRVGQDWETPYHQEARYVEQAVERQVFTRYTA